ncbi:MAG: hypothetical protein FJW14_12240 [Acidimicrobiia bacterium]|nr:hypothetical protein [Acidimicrobiia bacterium]
MRAPYAVAACAGVALLAAAPPVSSHNPITTTVVFNREVAAILNQKCSQCHVADGMAMPLQTYADVRPWAVAIKEEILARRMPPWPAERGYGTFANDAGLTQREQEFLISWIDGGVPPGAGEPPAHVDHSGHWMLGQPDLLHTGAAARGAAPAPGYTRFVVDPGLRTDTWIRAIDFKPADRRAIRAAFFSVAATGPSTSLGAGQYLGGWTPTHASTEFPDGAAVRLPAKATIAVDVLHGAVAPGVVEGPQLALYVAKGQPRPVTTLTLTGTTRSADGRVRAAQTLATDRRLLGLRAEMTAGATALEVKAMRPDGSVEPLLWIREYRADWPTPYVLRSPVPLPRGTRITATGFFTPDAPTPRVTISITAVSSG